jgi:hypothetical protein
VDLIVRPSAAADVEEAFSWYEQQRPGLGEQFLDVVDAALREIAGHPLRQTVIFREPIRICWSNPIEAKDASGAA